MSEEIISPEPVPGQRVSTKRKGPAGRRKPKDGEIGIRYGNRNYIKSPGQSLIAKQDKWHLVVCPAYTRDGWFNFKLYLKKKKQPKNMWGISFGRNSLIATNDLAKLKQYSPEMVPWVLEQALKYAQGLLKHKDEEGEPVVFKQGKGWALIKEKENG